jgi:titin
MFGTWSLKSLLAKRPTRPAARPQFFHPRIETFEDRLAPALCGGGTGLVVVNSPGDAGAGSLRQAIMGANISTGLCTIQFAIGSGVATIQPLSPLPPITQTVSLLGNTQPGYSGSPLIVLDGTRIGTPNVDGLVIAGLKSTVTGLVVNNFTGAGIRLTSSGNTLTNSYIGTDVTCSSPFVGNGTDGVVIDGSYNVVGGTTAGAGNVISGNYVNGVHITANGTNNVVAGNYIGTDCSGSFPLSNGNDGVLIDGLNNTVGGAAAGVRNVISGNNGNGVEISVSGSNNVVAGNYIGTNSAGSAALPNFRGVYVLGDRNTVGGTTDQARNVISGNSGYGIEILGRYNLVAGNYIGTDVTGLAGLANGLDGVLIIPGFAQFNTIGGTTAGARNVISGNGLSGVHIWSGAAYNVVAGNYIGTDFTGMTALGNSLDGVQVEGPNNTIGGTTAGARNVISGNWDDGVNITGEGNLVQGNSIGTNVSGGARLPNANDGVYLNGGRNLIGGPMAGAGNLISANTFDGVSIWADDNVVLGNSIGTSSAGTPGLGNGRDGVGVHASYTTVGDGWDGSSNLIASNGRDGVRVERLNHDAILGNRIFSHRMGSGINLVSMGNDNQPAPVLTSVTSIGGNTTIQGVLNMPTLPFEFYTLEFFSNPSGGSEGEQFLGRLRWVATDYTGGLNFSPTFPVPVARGTCVTATATVMADFAYNNDTSSFSTCAPTSPGEGSEGNGIPAAGMRVLGRLAAMAGADATGAAQALPRDEGRRPAACVPAVTNDLERRTAPGRPAPAVAAEPSSSRAHDARHAADDVFALLGSDPGFGGPGPDLWFAG